MDALAQKMYDAGLPYEEPVLGFVLSGGDAVVAYHVRGAKARTFAGFGHRHQDEIAQAARAIDGVQAVYKVSATRV
jgi:hypothetical protein